MSDYTRYALVVAFIALCFFGIRISAEARRTEDSNIEFVAHDQGYDEGYERGTRDNLREMMQAHADLTKAFSECIEREMQCNNIAPHNPGPMPMTEEVP